VIWELALESVQVLIAFTLFLCAHGLGVVRERNRKTSPIKRIPNLSCGCGHQLAMHSGLGGCNKQEQIYVGVSNRQEKYKLTPCGCQQETGELPEDWFARDSMRELYSPPEATRALEEKEKEST